MDRLFTNCRLLTMDAANPEANAFATAGSVIVAVGEAASLLTRRDRGTTVVDLGGRMVVPGFIDAHTHMGPIVLSPEEIDLAAAPAPDVRAIQERMAEGSRRLPPGAWVRASGYSEWRLAERRHPTRWELDEAVPDRPAVLLHWSYHRLVANSLALQAAGIRKGHTEVPNGIVHCDSLGEPNGLLTEAGTNGVYQAMMDAVIERNSSVLLDWVEAACRRYLALGVTSVHDAWVPAQTEAVFRRAAEAGRLPLYYTPLRGHSGGLFGTPATWLEPGSIDAVSLPLRFRKGGIKIFADGVWEGIVFHSQAELDWLIESAHRLDLIVAIHVTSDVGTSMALNGVESARKSVPAGEVQIRIEHLFGPKFDDIDRLKRSEIAVVTQPASLLQLRERTGPSEPGRAERVPIQSLRSAGVTVAFSSDAPCFPMAPLTGIAAAVTRTTPRGEQIDAEQAVSLEQAISHYAIEAACAGGSDQIEGSISPGKLANFVVLSADSTVDPLEDPSRLLVDETWVDGVLAYARAMTVA